MERALIAEYERDMDAVQAALTPATRDVAIELAALPLEIRGFGQVKARRGRGGRRAAAPSFSRPSRPAGAPRLHAAE